LFRFFVLGLRGFWFGFCGVIGVIALALMLLIFINQVVSSSSLFPKFYHSKIS